MVGEFCGAGNVATIVKAIELELHGLGLSAECPWFFPLRINIRNYSMMLVLMYKELN